MSAKAVQSGRSVFKWLERAYWLGLGIMIACLVMVFAGRPFWPDKDAASRLARDPRYYNFKVLLETERAIRLHFGEHKELPKTISPDVQKKMRRLLHSRHDLQIEVRFSRAREEAESNVLDFWGNALVYKYEDVMRDEFKLYSMGPNGRDDNGTYDDDTPLDQF